MKLTIIGCLSLLTQTLSGQVNNNKPARDSFNLVIFVNNETYYNSHIISSPYIVGPNILQLFPGENVFIEIDHKDDVIAAMRSVRENKNPEITLEISFIQNADDKTHQNMMLKVKNPFKYDLSYSAMIRIMETGKWVNTSIMPVKAGLLGFEMWPDIIISIAMNEWKFIKP